MVAFLGCSVYDLIHYVLHNMSSESAGLQAVALAGAYPRGIGRLALVGQLEDKGIRAGAELELNAAFGPVSIGMADFICQGFFHGKGDRARLRIVPSQSGGQASNSMPHRRQKTNVGRQHDSRFNIEIGGGHGVSHGLFLPAIRQLNEAPPVCNLSIVAENEGVRTLNLSELPVAAVFQYYQCEIVGLLGPGGEVEHRLLDRSVEFGAMRATRPLNRVEQPPDSKE